MSDWNLPSGDFRGKIVKVHDGDTVTVLQRDGSLANVRLANIDAPELMQQGGTASRDRLRDLIYGRDLNVAATPDTTYGRAVGTLLDRNATNYNLGQVRSGNATAYEQFLRDPAALQAQAEAAAAKAGFWATGGPPDAAAFRHAQPQSMPIPGGTQNGLRGSSINDTIEYLRSPRVIQDLMLDGGKSNQPSDDPTFDIAMQYRKEHGDFRRGLHSSIEGMKAGYNRTKAAALEVAGDKAGAKELYDLAKSQEVEAAITAPKRFTEIGGVGDAVDWAQGALGQGVASAGPILAAAAMAKLGLRKTALKSLAPYIGAGVPSFGMQLGENMSNFQNNEKNTLTPGQTLAAAALTALPQAALDTFTPGGLVAGKTLRALVQPGKKNLMKYVAGEALKSAGEEAVTEGLQETIGQLGEKALVDRSKEIDLKGIIDSAAAGAVGGMGMSAPFNTVEGLKAQGAYRRMEAEQRRVAAEQAAAAAGRATADQNYADLAAQFQQDNGPDMQQRLTGPTPTIYDNDGGPNFTMHGSVYPPMHRREAPIEDVTGGGWSLHQTLPYNHIYEGSDLPDPTLREAPTPAVTDMTPKVDIGQRMLEQSDSVVASALSDDKRMLNDWHSHTPEEKAQLIELIRDHTDNPKVFSALSGLFGSEAKVNEVAGALQRVHNSLVRDPQAKNKPEGLSLDDDGKPIPTDSGHDLTTAGTFADTVHGVGDPLWRDDPTHDARAAALRSQAKALDSSIKQMDKQMYMQKVPYGIAISKHLDAKYPLVPAGAVDDPQYMEQHEAYVKEQMALTDAVRQQAKERLVAEGADPSMISKAAIDAEVSKAYAMKAVVSDYRPGDFSRDELDAMKMGKKRDGKYFEEGRVDLNMVQSNGEVKPTPISLMSLVVETARKRSADGDHGNLSVSRIGQLLSDGITTLMNMPGVSKSEPFGTVEGGKPAVTVDPETGEMAFNIPDDTLVYRYKDGRRVTFGEVRSSITTPDKAYHKIRNELLRSYKSADAGEKAAINHELRLLEEARGTLGDIIEQLNTPHLLTARELETLKGQIDKHSAEDGYIGQLFAANKKLLDSKLETADLENQTATGEQDRSEADTAKLNKKGRVYQEETGEQLGAYANDISERGEQAAAEADVDAIIREAERGRKEAIAELKREYPAEYPTQGQERVLALMQALIERFAPSSDLQIWFTKALPIGTPGIASYNGAIILSNKLQGAKLVEVATHEFGHWLQNTVFEALPKNDPARKQIEQAWENAVTRLFDDKMTAEEYAAEFYSAGTASLFEGDDTSGAALVRARAAAREAQGKDVEYPISFPEWFANQFSKYATSGQLFEGANEHTARFMERLLKHMTKLFETMQAVLNVLGELVPSAWRRYKPAEAFTKWVDSLPASYTVRWSADLPDTTRGITPEMMKELRMSPEEAAARMAQRANPVEIGVKQLSPEEEQASVKRTVDSERAAVAAENRAYEKAKDEYAKATELGMDSVAPSPPWDHPDNAPRRERLAQEIMKDKRKAERSNAAKAGWEKRRAKEAELREQAEKERAERAKLLEDIEAAMQNQRGAMKNAFKKAMDENTDGTKQSRQTPRGEGLNDDMTDKLVDALRSMFGDRIRLLFTKAFAHGGSGQFSTPEIEGVIRKVIVLATKATDPRGVLYHEALHAFVHELNQIGGGRLVKTLLRAAGSAPILNQLKERLKDDPQALKSLEDPEERAAFMLQFYATDPTFTFGPQATTFMDKVRGFISQVFKVMSTEQQAKRILDYLMSGQHVDGFNRPSAAYKALFAKSDSKVVDTALQTMSAVSDSLKKFIIPGDWLMRGTKIPALKKLARMIYPTVGEGGDEGYLQSITRLSGSYFGSMAKHFDGTTEEQRLRVLEALHAGDIRELSVEDKRLANEVRRTLQEVYAYANEVVDMGNLGEDYFPRVWDRESIMANQDGFLAMLAAHDIKDGEKVMRRILAEEMVDITDGESRDVGYTPAMSAALKRKLADISNAEASAFLNKDLLKTMHTYVRQTVKRTEYTRRFGANGERLNSMLLEARAQGATKSDLEQARKYVMAAEGTLGYDIDPKLRDLMGGITLYENIRLLPMVILSSVVDPIGIAVRSGDMRDAFTAFARGISEIAHYLKKAPEVKDDMMQLAIDIGVMDHNVLLDAYQLSTGTEFMSARQKKFQDMFFKYNMMSGWNHSMRTAAVSSAIQFITRHALNPNKHSARYLSELNLPQDKLYFSGDGSLLVRTEDVIAAGGTKADAAALQAAIHRYVDGAVLRPNAAHRPIWMSDPHYALLSHLKQFTYSFHQTILKRVAEEAKHGNYGPLLPLLSYVPVSIAASFVKGIVQGGGDDPEWKRGWGVADYVWDGVQRAGVLGIRQFGVDIMEDVGRGDTGLSTIIGPAASHVLGFARDITRGNVKHAVIDSLPANDMYGATLSRVVS